MTEMTDLHLVAGRRYITRAGDITSPLEFDPEPIGGQEFTGRVDGIVRNWDYRGRWAGSAKLSLDLVAEA